MSRDQYSTRRHEFETPEEIFERIAARWFDVDEATLRSWKAKPGIPGNLFCNLQAVFVAGYQLGSEHNS